MLKNYKRGEELSQLPRRNANQQEESNYRSVATFFHTLERGTTLAALATVNPIVGTAAAVLNALQIGDTLAERAEEYQAKEANNSGWCAIS